MQEAYVCFLNATVDEIVIKNDAVNVLFRACCKHQCNKARACIKQSENEEGESEDS